MPDRGYALDLGWPIRHVVTELERSQEGLSVSDLARTFQAFSADLGRIRLHEHCASDEEAKQWLMGAALDELSRYVGEDGGLYRLVVPVEKVRWQRRRVHPIPADEEGLLDRERQIRAAYNQMRMGAAFSVQVEGSRGSVRERRLKLHPLAMTLPLMPEKEFTELVEDVRTNGFTSPIHTIGEEVLDGRHRVAVSSALNASIRVVEFTGTEEESRHFVVSQNLRRRHLTTAQRTQLVRELYMSEATLTAAENKLRGNSRGGKSENVTTVDSPDGSRTEKKNTKGKTAAEIAAERSGGLASARSIAAMAPVDNAPETRAKVMSGEIKTVGKAREAALMEIGSDDPSSLPPKLRGTWDAIGRAKYWVEQAISSQQSGVGFGVKQGGRVPVTADEHLARLAEIRVLLDQYEAGLATTGDDA